MLEEGLLRLLQQDGRASYAQLAEEAGIPRDVVARRVGQEIANGSLRVTTVVHPGMRARAVVAHLSVWVVGNLQPLRDLVLGDPRISFISVVGGLYSLVLEVHCRSRSELAELCERVRSITHVQALNVLFYDTLLRTASVDVPPLMDTTPLDAIDKLLIRHLQQDGRATYAELGEQASTVASTALYRVKRLLAMGKIHIGAVAGKMALSPDLAMGAGLNLAGSSATAMRELASIPNVEFAATTLGRFDALLTFSGDSLSSLADTLAVIREHPAVTGVETWVHMEVLRESYDLLD